MSLVTVCVLNTVQCTEVCFDAVLRNRQLFMLLSALGAVDIMFLGYPPMLHPEKVFLHPENL